MTWKSQLEEINVKRFTPPLPASEIVTIQSHLEKKEYQYTCKEEPMSSHCNQSVCRGLKHGIGTTSMPAISGLSVILSEPRLWFLDIDGRRLELNNRRTTSTKTISKSMYGAVELHATKDEGWRLGGTSQHVA